MSLLLALNIFHNFFYCFYCRLWKPYCICLEQISTGKRLKYFKASGFPWCILNNTHFSETGYHSQKIRLSEDNWRRQQTKWYIQKVPCYDQGYLYQVLKLYPILSINKAINVEVTFCYRDHVCQVSKLQHMYAIGLIPLSVLETTKQTRLYQI